MKHDKRIKMEELISFLKTEFPKDAKRIRKPRKVKGTEVYVMTNMSWHF